MLFYCFVKDRHAHTTCREKKHLNKMQCACSTFLVLALEYCTEGKHTHTHTHTHTQEADDENGLPIGFRPEARNFDYHPGRAFTIQTVPNGHNSGKVFIFATDTVEECAECMSKIEEVQRATQKQIADEERSQRLQLWSRRIVTSTCVQSLVAVMITSTFFLAVVEAQVMYAPDWGDGDDSAATAKLKEETMHSFETVSKILTVFFIVELALNMTAFWFWEFWGIFHVCLCAGPARSKQVVTP